MTVRPMPDTSSNSVSSNHFVTSLGAHLPLLAAAQAVTLVHVAHTFLSSSSPWACKERGSPSAGMGGGGGG